MNRLNPPPLLVIIIFIKKNYKRKLPYSHIPMPIQTTFLVKYVVKKKSNLSFFFFIIFFKDEHVMLCRVY